MAASDPPTARQLAYLRALAERVGQTFAYPINRGAASREIDRLRRAGVSSRAERRLDTEAVHARAREDGVRVRDDELVGYGADAHWKGREQ